ncbi:MAG: hypothetical protein AB9836_04685 [Aminipila sp.]
MSKISVIGYQMSFSKLTNKLLEKDEDMYKKMLYVAKAEEVRKGFIATRVNKANSKGTKITFSCAKTVEEFDLYCKELDKEYSNLFCNKLKS